MHLPMDLLVEILSRVPATSLIRSRSASKQWNALLKDCSFVKTHSANAPKESLIIMLFDFRVYLVKIDLREPPCVKKHQFYLKDPLYNSSQVDIHNVFHCDGLLLCTTKDNRLVVWNPCSGESKWIKPRNEYKESDHYALGYDNKSSSSCKKYKILRFEGFPPIPLEYEIYDFTSDSWKVLVLTCGWRLRKGNGDGMSVKGNAYWLASGITKDIILSFDFSTESFQSLSLPQKPFPYSAVALSVVREEQLCVLFDIWLNFGIFSTDLHLWVTTNIGSSVLSWSKFLSLKSSFESHNYDVSFLLDEQNKALVCCNKYALRNKILHVLGENKHVRLYHGTGDSTCETSCSLLLNYVPSLAQTEQCEKHQTLDLSFTALSIS